MPKKQAQRFDKAGLIQLLSQLADHRASLASTIRAKAVGDVDFDDACTVRNAAQYLVTTCLAIKHINDTLLRLVEMSGKPESVPHLDACGLNWNPEDDE